MQFDDHDGKPRDPLRVRREQFPFGTLDVDLADEGFVIAIPPKQLGDGKSGKATGRPVIDFGPVAPFGLSGIDDVRVAVLTRDRAAKGNDMLLPGAVLA